MRVAWEGSNVRLRPAGPLTGEVRLPGSKSLTNRYLTCAALADGRTTLRDAAVVDDTRAMVAGLDALGIHVEVEEDRGRMLITGCRGQIPATAADINVGHAGTAMRFLTALATLGYGRYRIDGSPRMRQRPIGALVGALQALGAGIGYDASSGYPPVTMAARGLAGGEAHFDTPPSSQFISALLMAAPYASRDVFLSIAGALPSWPYVNMTIAVMRSMGVEVLASDRRRFIVAAPQRYQAGEYVIEPDASAATYFWAGAALTGGCIRVAGLTESSLQGDVGFARVLADMGCQVRADDGGIEVGAPSAGHLRGVDVDLNAMPDTVQTLAVVALFAEGPTRIRNVANLRLKETDRLAALATELTKLGAEVQVGPDGLTIRPPGRVRPAAIDTYGDHRMAMSFALAGLVVEGVVIRNAECVSKSFPGFFEALDRTG